MKGDGVGGERERGEGAFRIIPGRGGGSIMVEDGG